jgi:hypothetical protein
MISIESILPVRPPSQWRLLPERTTIQNKIFAIWPTNGRAYMRDCQDGSMTQVVVSIGEDNVLHVSVSNSKKALPREEAVEYIGELLPSYYVDFIPQEEVNRNLLAAGINTRVAVGEELAPIQHFEKQL